MVLLYRFWLQSPFRGNILSYLAYRIKLEDGKTFWNIDLRAKTSGYCCYRPILQLIATGLKNCCNRSGFCILERYGQIEPVEGFVVGLAKQMNNMPSESSLYIEPFVEKLKKHFGSIPVYRVDERFTSVIASQTIAHSGLKKKSCQNKSLIDTVSSGDIAELPCPTR